MDSSGTVYNLLITHLHRPSEVQHYQTLEIYHVRPVALL